MVAQSLSLRQRFFQFLLDKKEDFIQVLNESRVKILFDWVDMREQTFEEPIESDQAGEDSVYSEVLAGNIEKAWVKVLNLHYIVDGVEGGFEDFRAG